LPYNIIAYLELRNNMFDLCFFNLLVGKSGNLFERRNKAHLELWMLFGLPLTKGDIKRLCFSGLKGRIFSQKRYVLIPFVI
jgi:hypothetical protein